MELSYWGGMQLFVTPHAIKKGKRLFPESKHRSRRITKKLVKRFGGTHELIPCILRIGGNQVFLHPVMFEELKKRVANGV